MTHILATLGHPGELTESQLGFRPGRRMSPEGSGLNRVMIFGEAPGENEERDGLPFRPYAEAGSVLERAIYRAGSRREDFTLTNCVWYRPPMNELQGAPWELSALSACQPLNDALIGERKPKCLLALGATAFRELTGLSGRKLGVELTRGFIIESPRYGIPVVGSYHPSYLRRGSKEKSRETGARTEKAGGGGMALLGVLIRDIQLALEVAKSGYTKLDTSRYVLGGTLAEWEQLYQRAKADPSLVICYDLETRDSLTLDDETEGEIVHREITQVQVSLGVGEALVSRWTPDLVPILRKLFALPNTKLDWNGRGFDRPILRDYGLVDGLGVGDWVDGIDLWHHSQPDLPRGLQFAASFFTPEMGPWKHLSHSDELLYGAYDVDAPQRIYSALSKSLRDIREPHSGLSLMDGYERHVLRLSRALDRAAERGIPVSAESAQKLDAELALKSEEVLAEIQQLVPERARELKPKTGYKTIPKALGRHTCPAQCKSCQRIAEDAVSSRKRPRKLLTHTCQEEPCQLCLAEGCGRAETSQGLFVKAEFGNESRWAQLAEFNPNSSPQLQRYITVRREEEVAKLTAKKLKISAEQLPDFVQTPMGVSAWQWAQASAKYKVPVKFRTTDPTTGFKEIAKLAKATGDPLFGKVRDFRNIGKMRSTYIDGWKPGVDGRVHPKFGFKPATGQLSSTEPNCFPGEVEVLTNRGWQRWDEIRKWGRQTWKLAQYDMETGLISFAEPLRWIEQDYSGQLLRLHSSAIDVLATPNHTLVINQSTGRCSVPTKTCRFEDLPVGGAIPSAGRYDNPEVGAHLEPEQIALIAAVVACGTLTPFRKDLLFMPRELNETLEVRRLLDKLEVPFTRGARQMQNKNAWRATFRVARAKFPKWLRVPGEWMLQLSGEQVRDLAMSIYDWGGYWNVRGLYPEWAGWVQALAALGGIRATGEPCRGERKVRLAADVREWSLFGSSARTSREFSGKVYCAEMPKGTLVVRHNLKVAITGNSMNFPKHGPLSKTMRRIIQARPGYRLLEYDFKSYHALTLGFEARDASYMRMARLDIHSFFAAAGLLKLETPEKLLGLGDEELVARLSGWRKDPTLRYPGPKGELLSFGEIRDRQSKAAILGYGFGMGAARLYHENSEHIANIAHAQRLIAELDRLFPLTAQFRQDIRKLADRQGYLLSRHGHIRRFWDVFQRRPVDAGYSPRQDEVMVMDSRGMRWILRPGDDSEACIAFLPANDAFGVIDDVMVELAETGLDERFGFINPIHDALIFECLDSRVDEAIETVAGLMQAPSLALTDPVVAPGGLVCEVEAMISPLGGDWSQMEKIPAPKPKLV